MGFKFKPFAPPSHRKSRKQVEARTAAGYVDHKRVRLIVLERDSYRCQNPIQGKRCLKPATDVHHIIPTERGGLSIPRNMISLCYTCHCNQPGHGHMRANDAKNGTARGPTRKKTEWSAAPGTVKDADW